MEKKRLETLLEKYHDGSCNEEELQELYRWYESYGDADTLELPVSVTENRKRYLDAKFEEFKLLRGDTRIIRIKRVKQVFAAAAVLVVLLGIGWMWKASVNKKEEQRIGIVKSDILPGHTGAVLTLSNGSTVVLDSTGNTMVAQQGASRIKNINGHLIYNAGTVSTPEVVYNTLSTPRGRQYQLTLPDGSRVWLNAESSIRYPVAFTGKERKVEITGEAYFEVVHISSKPFKVIAAKTEIEDIGTHFNINAYGDEPLLKTTLLEGAVKICGHLLRPGQQAQVGVDQTVRVVELPDAENIIAWKEGIINFSAVDIATLLRQIERWYNVEVRVEGQLPDIYLTGTLPSSMKLSSVMKVFELNKIKCRLQGNELIVCAG